MLRYIVIIRKFINHNQLIRFISIFIKLIQNYKKRIFKKNIKIFLITHF